MEAGVKSWGDDQEVLVTGVAVTRLANECQRGQGTSREFWRVEVVLMYMPHK